MDNWKVEIKRFDDDLEAVMKVIRHYELTGIDIEESLSLFITRSLGFIDRKRFPTWRNSSREWAIRNKERCRVVNQCWRFKNRVRLRKTLHDWYLVHREEVIKRVKKRYREDPEPTKLRVKEWKKNHRKKDRQVEVEGPKKLLSMV